MAGSVNKVILVGHLGKDPRIQSFANGGRVANLSIATSETWRDKATGDRKERTEWHRVAVLPENLVGVVEKYLRKGSKVYVEGQLETREYEKDGRKAWTTEVVVRAYRGDITLLERQDTRPPDGTADDYDRTDAPRTDENRTAAQEVDDEIPF